MSKCVFFMFFFFCSQRFWLCKCFLYRLYCLQEDSCKQDESPVYLLYLQSSRTRSQRLLVCIPFRPTICKHATSKYKSLCIVDFLSVILLYITLPLKFFYVVLFYHWSFICIQCNLYLSYILNYVFERFNWYDLLSICFENFGDEYFILNLQYLL